MSKIKQKISCLRSSLYDLGRRLERGESQELLVWVIPNKLAIAHRPLRYHPQFGGSGITLPPESSAEVVKWIGRIKEVGIQSIISLMHPKELRHYDQLNLGVKNLIDLYQKLGFNVRHIPWEDPAHQPQSRNHTFQKELVRVQREALQAYDNLPKPVLLHCSAGIDRSSPVAAFIWSMHANRGVA